MDEGVRELVKGNWFCLLMREEAMTCRPLPSDFNWALRNELGDAVSLDES